jgi:hypothetical protein
MVALLGYRGEPACLARLEAEICPLLGNSVISLILARDGYDANVLGCVKTPNFNLRVEISSRFLRFENQ